MESIPQFDMAGANLSYLQRFVAPSVMISNQRNTFLPLSLAFLFPSRLDGYSKGLVVLEEEHHVILE